MLLCILHLQSKSLFQVFGNVSCETPVAVNKPEWNGKRHEDFPCRDKMEQHGPETQGCAYACVSSTLRVDKTKQ